jgi:hypothetical protein
MNIQQHLDLLSSTKQNIKTAIETRGVAVGTVPFSAYANKIGEIARTPLADDWSDAYYQSVAASVIPYTRPADWLELPILTNTESRVIILKAVMSGVSNYCALSATGDYTVDWGDNTIENIASGTTAYHIYSYDASALDGTESTLGYKQAIVQIYPQVGATLTSVNLQRGHNLASAAYTSRFLIIDIAGPSLTSVMLGADTDTTVPTAVYHTMLEHLQIRQNVITNMNGLCYGCESLRTVDLHTASATSTENMFSYCYNLQTVPALNLASVTNADGMFYYCKNLLTVPVLDMPAAASTTGMFSECYNLQTIPVILTPNATDMGHMFSYCYNLKNLPVFATASVTGMSSMFSDCYSLHTIPVLDTENVTDIGYMFSECYSLHTVPSIDISSAADMVNTFDRCVGLRSMQAMSASVSFSVGDCMLSAAALDSLYDNLATAVGQTIDVTGNWGTMSDDTTIATIKGWTVVGSA